MSNKNNKIFLILIIFVLFTVICNVNATNTDDNDLNDTIVEDNSVILSSSVDDFLSDGELSFSQLQSDIDKASNGSTLNLNNDYKRISASDMSGGIKINKTLTINGNGHSIDGSGISRIFNITGDGVILNNLIIKNALINNTINYINSTNKDINITLGNGAGILWIGNNGILNNSLVTGNTIINDVVIWNMSDKNANYVIGNGAGLYIAGENTIIENTNITENQIIYNIIYKYNYCFYPNGNIVRWISNGAGAFISGNNTIIRKTQFTNNINNGTYNNTDENGISVNSERLTSNYWCIGGALRLIASNVTINDSVFDKNQASQGSAIYLSGNKTNITNTNFTNNKGNFETVCAYNDAMNSQYVISFDNCYFVNNTAIDNYAGALTLCYSNSMVSNSYFINNSANTYAGAIYWSGNNGNIINSTFENNIAGTNAGAVYMSGSNGNIINSTFNNNTATMNGGSIYWASTTGGIINNSKFNNNTAFISNDIYRSSSLTITKNNFTGYYANISGTVLSGYEYLTIKATSDEEDLIVDIYIDDTYFDTVYIDAYTIGDTKVYLDGLSATNHKITLDFINGDNKYNTIVSTFTTVGNMNPIYVSPTGSGTIGDESHPVNWSYAIKYIPAGGTIILLNGTYTGIVNESIMKSVNIMGSGNSIIDTQGNGRVFKIFADNVTINHLTFQNNYIADNGGVLYWIGSYGLINNSVFTNNSANTMGAIYYAGNYGIINNSIFTNNKALTGGYGVLQWAGSNGIIENSVFNNNSANNDEGAIWVSGNYAKLINCNFTNNIAGTGGTGSRYAGAVYMGGSDGFVSGCNFINNSAGGNAGALYWNGANGQITNSNFTNNTAEANGGAIYYNGANGKVTKCNFINNTASVSNDIYRANSGLLVYYNNFTGNYADFNKIIFEGFEELYIKATSDELDLLVNIIIDGINTENITITSKKAGDTSLILSNLVGNTHNVTLKFISSYNSYKCSVVDFYSIPMVPVLYVSPDGDGDGFSQYSPANFTYAYDIIPDGGIIILLNGTYYDIKGLTISKSITIRGSGNTILDAQMTDRFFELSKSNITIDNIKFTNGGSRGLIIGGYNVVISNSIFYNNYAGGDGGAIFYGSTKNSIIINCTFVNNSATSRGGAIMYDSSGNNGPVNCSIINSTFINNTANTQGGAIGFHNVVNGLNIINSTFTNNSVYSTTGYGGALFITSNGQNVHIIGSTFSYNNAYYGGSIYWLGKNGVVNNSNFINNNATISNDIYRSSDLKLSGNTFTGKYIDIPTTITYSDPYTAIRVTADNDDMLVKVMIDGNNTINFTITGKTMGNVNMPVSSLKNGPHNITFIFNSTTNTYISIISNFTIIASQAILVVSPDGSSIIGDEDNPCNWTYAINHIKSGGTIILLNGTYNDILNQKIILPVTIKGSGNTTLDGQSTNNFFSINSDNVTIDNIIFINGRGTYAAIVVSGDYTKGDNCVINNSMFINNYATSTSTVQVNYVSNFKISNTIFTNNYYAGPYSGGALWFNSGGTSSSINATVFNCTFTNNTSIRNGGAIGFWNYVYGCKIINCTFTNNTASGNGGAISSPMVGGDVSIFNSTFINNYASNNGGAILCSIAGVTIDNCTFINNSAKNSFNNIYATKTITTNSLSFYGDFIELDKLYSADVFVKINIFDIENSITIKISVNDTNNVTVTVTSTDNFVYLPKLGNGTYSISFTGETSKNNYHSNLYSFTVTRNNTLFVSRNGEGIGTIDDPCSWSYALENVPVNGTIIFLEGTYKNIINQNIDKTINIGGRGEVVLDGGRHKNIFTVNSDNVVISNITFKNAYTSSSGAALNWLGVNGGVFNCTFINNTAETSSNDIYRGGNNLNISNCTFNGNYIKMDGTYTIKITSSNEDIIVCVVVDGNVKSNVTVVGNSKGDSVFTLSNLTNGEHNITLSFYDGDNVYVQNKVVIFDFVNIFYVSPILSGVGTLDDPCSWDYAYSNIVDGGTIILLDGTYYIRGVSITKSITIRGSGNTILDAQNTATAIFSISKPNVIIDNIKFINDKKYALFISGSYVVVSNSKFYNNSASYGGAIYYGYSIGSKIINCTFVNNSASERGGAIHHDSTGTTGAVNCSIINCTFINNKAKNGGALSLWNWIYDWSIINSTFTNNSVTSTTGVGGAIYITGGGTRVSVIGSNFTNNKAYNGGSIYISGNDFVSTDCIFSNNNASNEGGGIYTTKVPKSFDNLKFYNNTAKLGSAIRTTQSLTISNSEFKDNLDSSTITYTYNPTAITVTYNGKDGYLNGIGTGSTVTFVNVSYWNGGVKNAPNDIIYLNAKYNVSIVLELYDMDNNTRLISNYTDFTNSNGVVSFDGWDMGSYHVVIYHMAGPTKSIMSEFDYVYVVYASADGNGSGYNKSSPTDLTNALNICENGGKIFLNGGTYNITETINISKSVTIIGSGEDTILDGLNSNRILNVVADNVYISNVVFRNGVSDLGGAIYWGGKGGILNNTYFYNNTATNGSAIYVLNDLEIYNSVFEDNLAEVDFIYNKTDDGFTVHVNSHDNYINAIYTKSSNMGLSNVTYWGKTGKVTDSIGINGTMDHNLSVILSHKINQTEIEGYTDVTDENGNITKQLDLSKNIYYAVTIKHFTGMNRFRSLFFDIPANITLTRLELYVPEEISLGDNLTVFAFVENNATGNIVFRIGSENYTVSIVDGYAYLNIDPNLSVGVYNVTAVYVNDTVDYYGQINSTEFSIKVRSSPTVTILINDMIVNGTEITIKCVSNFVLPENTAETSFSLQFVVLT